MKRRIFNFMGYRVDESTKLPEGKEALINVFFEELEAATKKAGGSARYPLSYSSYASNANASPEKDMDVMMDHFEGAGWTAEVLKNFFAHYGEEVNSRYEEGKGCDQSALPDLFLFKGTKGKTMLAGYDYKEMVKEQGAGEYWIKFSYGYHRTAYGRLAIKQYYGSVSAFIAEGADILATSLFDGQDNGSSFTKDAVKGSVSQAKEAFQTGLSHSGDVITVDLSQLKDEVNNYPEVKAAIIKDLDDMGFHQSRKATINSASISVDGDVLTLTVNRP